MSSSFRQYQDAVTYLESLANIKQQNYLTATHGRSIFLRRCRALLQQLGNPQLKLRYVHVGGTSGKGSVATMIQSILTAGGCRTGLYTSPYPTTFAEKISVDGRLIGARTMRALTEKLKIAIDQTYLRSRYGQPSYFEASTALALLYFAAQRVDYAVLEVGVGGRYDATNVIPAPAATVINTIGLDHVELLGDTVEKIAREKAAIIKLKTHFFTPQSNPPAVRRIFQTACRRAGAEFHLVPRPKTPFRLNLLGDHQQQNAAIAAAVCRRLGVHDAAISRGLRRVTMPCRLEVMQKKPLVILDGAHNQSKVKTTTAALKHLTYKKLYLIIALTHERNPGAVFKNIIPLADGLYVTRYRSAYRRCYPPLELARKLKTAAPIQVTLDADRALDRALHKASARDLVLVTGSLFLAGELRRRWRSEKRIVAERRS
ncbi:MAG: hypothetical protein A3J59_03280 [Candidatus Buchananbacteria bacterium RIFCSPHIGHO2_02_FULL_56_16]|uniref:tetrahydrofolate synthase n=1 Tax=Candidatus Buchananbacteria bacterium RIFCSPHIGHO2_02_FULL_56_16 TaxID=1797542 RepID=A0A1G1YEY8_9BACT|nr:MAG: hypothetical protein A3J59_03280 [Candidatus Buchananbacteria bacterium RIFCSPHIGHO2_02_FULL_56_16]